MLLKNLLKSKAQKTYAALSIAYCTDYNTIKSAILKTYELALENYRQILGIQEKMTDKLTSEKETYFNRWSQSKNVENDNDILRQMILIETFKEVSPII